MPKSEGMGAAVAHSISPELVLVCPELREHALRLLPAIDPDELFAVAPRTAIATAHRPRLLVALAVYLTGAVFVGALRATALTAVIVAAAFILSW